MKKHFYKSLITCFAFLGFALGQANAQCLDWANPAPPFAYNDFDLLFGGAPCDDGSGCPFNEIQDFEIGAAEAYIASGFIAGGTYAFSICNGPNAGSWVPDFTIWSPSGVVDAFGPGDGDGCTITWTASESGTYAILVNEAGQCGGGPNVGVPNGFPALTCTGGATCATACDAGSLVTTANDTVCAFDLTTFINTTSAVPNGGTHGLYFSNSQGGTGALGGNFILPGVADTAIFDFDLNGILSFYNFPPFAGTWVVYSAVSSDLDDAFNTVCSLSADSMVVTFSDMWVLDVNDQGDGSVIASPANPNPNITYLWSNGQTTSTATGFADGDIASVTVTDPYGCQLEEQVIVTIGGSSVDTCLTWVNPSPTTGWTDFNNNFGGAPCDDGTGCAFNEIQAFQVFASEAYVIDNFIAGGTYAFSMCNGPNAFTWVPDFTIIAPSGAVDASGPGDGDGCTITWTASESGSYLIVINEAGQCGGGSNLQTNNGFPAITCVENANCPTVTCDAGELTSTDPVSVCGPDDTFAISTDGTEDIPAAGGHGWAFSDELGGTGGLAGGFTLTNAAVSDSYNSDVNGVMSGNALPVLEGLWVVHSVTYSNAANPGGSICDISTDSIIVNFSPTTPPTVTVVDNGNSSATATAAGGTGPYDYLWSNGQTTATANNLPTGQYTVVVSDSYGCSGAATVSVVSGTENIESLTSLSISPNPTSGKFLVNLQLKTMEEVQLTILDVTGKTIMQAKDNTSGKQFSFDLSQQPASIYLLKITVGSDTMVRRVVLTR